MHCENERIVQSLRDLNTRLHGKAAESLTLAERHVVDLSVQYPGLACVCSHTPALTRSHHARTHR
jgi:hypothetical protein